MTHAQERRSPTASRVPLETLVEICGNEPGIPAFEAEALDVSAQGMHLRTAYLPEQGAPLVCRFEDHGREIVVEGVVAWRKESSKGGDFGVAFTALDSRSVDALRNLVKAEVAEGKDTTGEAPNGSRVRLHIEGLGSPMKARIRTGGVQKIQVGSSLEFLKVGRKLEIEDLDAGGRRSAQIDGVEVVVDARTQVPQLVVALRYEGATEDTPQPTVTDLGGEPLRAESIRIAPEAVTIDAGVPAADADPSPSGDVPEAKADDDIDEDETAADDDDDVSEALPAATRAARRVGHAAENAGNVARDASIAAARGVSKLFAGASAKLASLRERGKTPVKRRTAKPVEAPASLDGKRLRPQSGASKGTEAAPSALPTPKSHKRMAIGIALVAVAASASAIALRPAKVASKPTTSDATTVALDTALPAPAAPAATAGATALANGVVPLPGTPATTAAPAALGTEPGAPVVPPGSPVTANVPLFGPTPLATVEPAPLGPPPSGDAKSIEASEQNAAKAVAPAIAADEEFPDPIEHVDGSKKSDGSKSTDPKNAKPEDVPAWGKGKMHTPVIHRLRLDGPGSAINGVSDATGFTVLVPGRKLMEQGAAIVKRDPRVGRARTTNTPGGAQIRITFRESLPAYRVRLRRDYVEILLSAPEETAAKKPVAATKDAKEAPKAAAPSAKAIPAAKIAAKH